MDKPLVSIILPTFNRASTLSRAIDSVLNQTYKNLELIIIDDGSTDGTQTLLSKYQGSDKRVKVIYNNQNLGAPLSRNKGIKASKGNLIAFIDSDDEWKREKLSLQHIALIEHPTISIVYCGLNYFMSHLDTNHSTMKIKKDVPIKVNFYTVLKKEVVPPTSTILIKRKALTDVNYFSDIPSNQDYLLYLKLLHANYHFLGINKSLVNIYHQKDSISINLYKKKLGRISIINFINSLNLPKTVKYNSLSSQYFRLGIYELLNRDTSCSESFFSSYSFNPNIKSIVFLILTKFNVYLTRSIYIYLRKLFNDPVFI